MKALYGSVRRIICFLRGCLVRNGSEVGEISRPGVEENPVTQDMNSWDKVFGAEGWFSSNI